MTSADFVDGNVVIHSLYSNKFNVCVVGFSVQKGWQGVHGVMGVMMS